jgi:hypothetical protein
MKNTYKYVIKRFHLKRHCEDIMIILELVSYFYYYFLPIRAYSTVEKGILIED